jgi:hypothetical protein
MAGTLLSGWRDSPIVGPAGELVVTGLTLTWLAWCVLEYYPAMGSR